MKNNILIIKNILFLSYISLINCIIEIPLIPMEVKGVQKYKNIKIKIQNYSYNNKTVFIEEGKATINMNYIFLANVKIGSNEQEFNLVLDTGSSLLWVPKLNSKDSSEINHHYDPTKSTTSKYLRGSFSIKYGSGSCSGYFYSDNFKYFNDKKFIIAFGVAEKTNFNVDNGDGIIGLARSYDDKSNSFIYMLKKYGVTDSTLFSFKFNSNKYGASGQLFIGKHSDFSSNIAKSCPLIKYKDSLANTFWTCRVTGIEVKNSKIDVKSGRAFNMIFDTGTNMVLLPLNYAYDIQDKLKSLGCGFATEDSKSYQIVCSSSLNLPNFNFEINGNTYTITKDYAFYKSGILQYSNILFVDSSQMYIMGTPFFFAFHTLFDQESSNLNFYPKESSYLTEGTFITEDDIKPNEFDEEDDDSAFETFTIVLIIIILCLMCGLVIYKLIQCYQSRKNSDYPSSNYFSDNQNYNFL